MPNISTPVLLLSAFILGLAGHYLGEISKPSSCNGACHSQSKSKSTSSESTSKAKGSQTQGGSQKSQERTDGDDGEEEQDSEDEAMATALRESAGTANARSNEECKMVLVVRTDLGMTKGKIAAQCSHATLACYKTLLSISSPILKRWERLGQAKIAVQCKGEDELLTLQATAMSLGICARVIHDAGRTQIAAGSATVLGIGPAPKSLVDQVTGHLKLL